MRGNAGVLLFQIVGIAIVGILILAAVAGIDKRPFLDTVENAFIVLTIIAICLGMVALAGGR